MKSVFYADEIRAVERAAFDAGVTEDELIERAAAALAEEVAGLEYRRAVIFAGGGNNGSDALSLALRLLRAGRETIIFPTSERRNEYVAKRLAALREAGADVRAVGAEVPVLRANDLVVDGMLGIGCTRPVTGALADIIQKINAADGTVVAVDIPTGLDADTGRVMGVAVEADTTVTFSALKSGLLLADGRNYCGKVIVREIGLTLPPPRAGVTEAADVALPPRRPVSNKGTYGNVAIIAGSPTMMGASLLAHESAGAALRSGAGYAVLCVPESLKSIYQLRVKEELLRFLPDVGGKVLCDAPALDAAIAKARAVVIGMGMGANPELIEIIAYLAQNYGGPLVVDGDGLNALAADPAAVAGHRCKLILTPHVAEFARLERGVFGANSDAPDTERCAALAAALDAVIAMKSATTVIADGRTVRLNVTGTPAMAKAGSGDVLGGMVGAFAATAEPLTAVLRACYEFGKAGERAAADRGETSVLASDIIVRI